MRLGGSGRESLTSKGTAPDVFVSRVRRQTLTHAFERALEDARDRSGSGTSDGEGPLSTEAGEAAQKLQSTLEALAEHPGAEGRADKVQLAAAYRYEMGDPKPAPVAPAAKVSEPVKAAPSEKPAKAPEPPDPIRAATELSAKLGANPTVAEIRMLRRQFALGNHPDRVPDNLRKVAAETMASVNAQIDQALKRARGK